MFAFQGDGGRGGTLGIVAAKSKPFELSRLQLSSGEGRRVDLELPLEPLEYGEQRYAIEGGSVPVRLDVSRTTTGWSLRLRYEVRLDGPCMRCLEPAGMPMAVDTREIDQPETSEELDSPYVHEDELDLTSWARDALALALPVQIVCRKECLGLCAICGANLNEDPTHGHEREPDPRWAKLRELKLE
jgi:uncharacterized protein